MVIPVKDVNPVPRVALVTYALIAANVVVFLLTPTVRTVVGAQPAAQICRQEAFYHRFAAIPRELVTNHPLPRVPTGQVVRTHHGLACALAGPAYDKQPALSVLFAMFLHGGWLHLLGNMLFLWIFGNNVEDRLGRIRFLVFYLVCGYASAYGFALANPGSTQPLIGASGAIAGTLGGYLLLFPRARVWSLVPFLFFIPLRLPAWLVIGLWFVLQWVYSVGYAVSSAGSVAYLAHVVGFVVGMLLTLVLARVGPTLPPAREYRHRPARRRAPP